ncbi:MAG TPA: DUF4440 domain-containing protein [Caldilineae bacterium]|nr:DUF4440 domain-containing protein [Caldilineae bacterium]
MRKGWFLFLLIMLLVACSRSEAPARSPTPTPIPRTPTPVPSSDEEAILQLLNAEAEAVVAQDIDRLEEIWAKDGVVIDAKHTPDNPDDDARWQGWDAIRERYVVVVFPGAPQMVAHPLVDIKISGDTAVVTTTTQIGSEVAAAGDRWTFARRDGRWVITSLTYNLEPE